MTTHQPTEPEPAPRRADDDDALDGPPDAAAEETYVDSPGAGLLGVIDDSPEPNEPG